MTLLSKILIQAILAVLGFYISLPFFQENVHSGFVPWVGHLHTSCV